MRTRPLTSAGLVFVLSAGLLIGCGSKSRPSNLPVSSTSQAAPATTGTVGQLTGDPDDQVSQELNMLVAQAIALDENDQPLDF